MNKNILIGFFLVLGVLALGSGKLFSIFGEEFQTEAQPYMADGAPIKYGTEGEYTAFQGFNAKFTTNRAFLYPTSGELILNAQGFESIDGVGNNYTFQGSRFSNVYYSDYDTRLAAFGVITTVIPDSEFDTYVGVDCFVNDCKGYYMKSEAYCQFKYGDADCSKQFGYYLFVNGVQIKKLDAVTQLMLYKVAVAGTDIGFTVPIPAGSLKNYYNDIQIKWISPNRVKEAVQFKIYVEPKECTVPGDYVTRFTAVSAGNAVSLNPTGNQITFPGPDGKIQTENDIIFCHTKPVQKIGAGGTASDTVPYDVLLNNATVTVPFGETWVMYWMGKPSSQTTTLCIDGTVYNSQTNACEVGATAEFICTDGIYDPVRKACVVQQNSSLVCSDPSAVFNQATEKCEKPIETQSATCSGQRVEENGFATCISEPTQEFKCVDSIASNGSCLVVPVITAQNGVGWILPVIILVLLGAGAFFLFGRRK